MTLESGSKLGVYEIVGPLASGGMGEIYRARDTALGREVAIKSLPSGVAQDSERLERFEREAKLLASLNHPNIAVIHGLERRSDGLFLVLELVPGTTLADRIHSAPVSVADAIAIFIQVARALEAAHEKGIVHRDLKPSNIQITAEGTVKLLDFGLGKEIPKQNAEVGAKETATYEGGGTRSGMILGTPAYMSPEQARGRDIDKRTDIWSFGVCLFETLAGRSPFLRGSVPDTLSAILNEEPDWHRLPRHIPGGLSVLLDRCLKKNERDRLHDIADARIELAQATESRRDRGAIDRPGRGVLLPWAVAGVLALVAAGTFFWAASRARSTAGSVDPTVKRFVFDLPPTAPMSLTHRGALTVSPDGTRLVYAVRRGDRSQLYMRHLDQLETIPVPGTEHAGSPFFSPDSTTLGFFAEGKLLKLLLPGGSPVPLADGADPRGGTWLGATPPTAGRILFAPLSASGLVQVSSDGGTTSVLTQPDAAAGERGHRWPSVLPDGRHALFTRWTDAGFDLAIVELASGDVRPLLENGSQPRYAPTGHLLFARDGALFATTFDPKAGAILSESQPVQVVDAVAHHPQTGAAFYDFSSDGTLFYASGNGTEAETGNLLRARLLLIDRNGSASPLGEPGTSIQVPRISPNERHLLMTTITNDRSDIWSLDLDRGNFTRLTFEGNNASAIWDPGGARILFASDRGENPFAVFSKASDGSGEAERLTRAEHPQFPTSVSANGRTILYTELHPETGLDIWVLEISEREGSKPRPLLQTSYNEAGAVFSPDGKWVAYTSDESGAQEVYVRAYPGESRAQISTSVGSEPVWSRDGSEITFRGGPNGSTLMSVNVSTSVENELVATVPRALFEAPFDDAGPLYANYDVSPDGRHFVMIRSDAEAAATELHVVLNWFEELRRRVPIER